MRARVGKMNWSGLHKALPVAKFTTACEPQDRVKTLGGKTGAKGRTSDTSPGPLSTGSGVSSVNRYVQVPQVWYGDAGSRNKLDVYTI